MIPVRVVIALIVISILIAFIIKQLYSYKIDPSCPICSKSNQCCLKNNSCGSTIEYCGIGCQSGPCINNNTNTSIITKKNFQCAFPLLNTTLLNHRFQALKKSGWLPINKDEAAVFLSHVSHETDGLQTYVEYCQSSKCLLNSCYYFKNIHSESFFSCFSL